MNENNLEKSQEGAPERTPEQELSDFQSEIQSLKDQELQKKRGQKERGETFDYNPHFEAINPWRLGPLELEVWKKFKGGSLTAAEYEALFENMRRSRGVGLASELDGMDLRKIDIAGLEGYRKIIQEPENFSEITDFWAYVANLNNRNWKEELFKKAEEGSREGQ